MEIEQAGEAVHRLLGNDPKYWCGATKHKPNEDAEGIAQFVKTLMPEDGIRPIDPAWCYSQGFKKSENGRLTATFGKVKCLYRADTGLLIVYGDVEINLPRATSRRTAYLILLGLRVDANNL